MIKKFLIFLFIIFLSSDIVYSQYKEKSLDSILKYIGTLRRIITVNVPREFEIVFEIYNILLEKDVDEVDKDKMIKDLNLQITKFKNIKKELFSYKMPKDLDFYLILSAKTVRDNAASNINNIVKADESLIEYIKTKDKNYFISAYNFLKVIFDFSF